jgi:hypothetical protein
MRICNLVALTSLFLALSGDHRLAIAQDRPFLFGCGHFNSTWAERPASYDLACWDHMANIGVTITGAGLAWCDAEPTQGEYDWDVIDRTDFAVKQIRARGMEPTFFLGLTPKWAALHPELPPHRTPAKEEYVEEFKAFHRFVAERYRGWVKYYFFWNEPNGCSWINEGCGNADGFPLYTKWLIRCSQAVKEADPDAKIIAGRLDYHADVKNGADYIQGMYDHGAAPHIDGIAIHPYNGKGGIHWKAIEDTRAVMVANDDEEKGIWLTEYGWNNGKEQQKAQWLKEVLNELQKPKWHYVFQANYLVLNDGKGVENYGLTDADLHPRPAYYTFRELALRSDPSTEVKNPSFEEGAGSLTGWQIVHLGDEGPDLPALDNANIHGPATPFGSYFAGKVTNWLKMNFHLGQIVEVQDYDPSKNRVEWSFSAHVNLHSSDQEETPQPSNVHQVWEIGWNKDGSLPADINTFDKQKTIASINATFTNNSREEFKLLQDSGVISNKTGIKYVVLRVHIYNDQGVLWSINNIDNVSFTAKATH